MRSPDHTRRVVVTGLGVVSSVGNDKDTAWSSLTEGRSGLAELTRFDVSRYEHKAGGEVKDFDPAAWMDPKAVRRSEREMHYGVAAAKQAVADSGFEITDQNRTDVGVVFGSGAGGQQLMIDNFTTLVEKGPNRVQPTFIANALVDSTSGMIAIETGAIGHNICIVSACSTGTHNVGEGAEAIRRGDCIAVISGSTEAPLLEVAHAGFTNMRGMGSPRPGEPLQTVSRPFDATRNGFVLGEGAGSLMLEDLELAKARGAKIYAEVIGYGSAAREAEAIWAVFGDRASGARRSLAISGTKSMTGHMMGAAGAFEAFATVMSVAEQTVPGTLNYRDADPACDLWVVDETVRMPVRYALSNNIGLGGHNGAVIFKRYDGD